jgi:hypothetical protein
MKKLLLVYGLAMTVLSATAQINTKVLLEMTTATGCYHCPSGNHYIDSLQAIHPDKLIVLRYQLPLNSYDPIYYQDSAEIKARARFMFGDSLVYGLPGSYCNGSYSQMSDPHAVTSETIDSIYQQTSHFQIALEHLLTADYDSMTVTLSITCDTIFEFGQDPPKAHITLMEDSIFFNTPPGNNGEKDFFYECRKFIPSVEGWNLPSSWTAGMTQTYSFSFPIPAYIYDLNNLYMTGFIQHPTTRRILQSVRDNQMKLPNYAGIDKIRTFDIQPFTCDTMLSGLKAFIKNLGTLPLTSFNLLYAVDAHPFDTLSWMGSIAPDSLVSVNLPAISLGSDGKHSILLKVIRPNDFHVADSYANQFAATVELHTQPDEPPVHEYFNQPGFPYKGWYVHNPNRDNNTWRQYSALTYPGNYKLSALLLRSFTMMTGTINEFFLPELAVHSMSSMTLYFDVSHVMTGGAPDTLTVLISDNCGETWQEVYRKRGDELAWTSIPWPEWIGDLLDSTDASGWKRQTITLQGYQQNSTLLIKFRYHKANGNNVYIRNVYAGPHVGIIESGKQNLIVYPNPASGLVRVKLTGTATSGSVSLIDYTGRVIFCNLPINGDSEFVTPDLSSCAEGIYLIHVKTNLGTLSRKIVLSH